MLFIETGIIDIPCLIVILISWYNIDLLNYYGGAIYFAAKGTVDSSNFTYNRAKIGSAIYYYNPGESKITNTVLLKNKADAKSFSIEQSANVFTITFSGNDNHLNAIYTRNDEALEFENVTYWGAKGISNTGSKISSANSNEPGQNITVSISHDDISVVDGVLVTDEKKGIFGGAKWETVLIILMKALRNSAQMHL